MSKIVPFKSPASKARVADMAATAMNSLELADLAADVRRERLEKAQETALAQLEQALRKLYNLMDDPSVARTRAQFVHAKVDLDYGVVRIL